MKPLFLWLAIISLIAMESAVGAETESDGTSSAPAAAWGRGVEGQRKADLGNGFYLNPILAGDRPDPSVLKVGKDYYLVNSSFESTPGLMIWHSLDLVNWEPIGPALQKYVGSVWAPDLVYHNGRFYIYFPAVTSKNLTNMVVYSDRIRGPWSDPIDLSVGNIDPGHGWKAVFVLQCRLFGAARGRRASRYRAREKSVRRMEISGRLGCRDIRSRRSEGPSSR